MLKVNKEIGKRNSYYAAWKRAANYTAQLREYVRRTRREALEHYGGRPPRCACCGEGIYEFLTLDHRNGDGAAHRRALKTPKSNTSLWSWLKRHNYPPGFQVLCFNCNCGKGTRAECPHKKAVAWAWEV